MPAVYPPVRPSVSGSVTLLFLGQLGGTSNDAVVYNYRPVPIRSRRNVANLQTQPAYRIGKSFLVYCFELFPPRLNGGWEEK